MTYCEEYIENAKYTNDNDLFSLIIQLSLLYNLWYN